MAYVDLKAAFDSVDRNALWQLLSSLGIPPKILSLFMALYTATVSCVKVDGHNSEWFPILSGVRQGCVVAGSDGLDHGTYLPPWYAWHNYRQREGALLRS